MLAHNPLLIYRNFKRFKISFFINLIGLSIGLASTIRGLAVKCPYPLDYKYFKKKRYKIKN